MLALPTCKQACTSRSCLARHQVSLMEANPRSRLTIRGGGGWGVGESVLWAPGHSETSRNAIGPGRCLIAKTTKRTCSNMSVSPPNR